MLVSVAATDVRAAHAAGVQRLLASYRSIPENATVRLAKPTSNLFRARGKNTVKGLDTSGLTGVIAVDPDARTADGRDVHVRGPRRCHATVGWRWWCRS